MGALLNEHFADTGALHYHLLKAGHQSEIIIANCEPLQKKWAEENDIHYSEDNWMKEIAFAQIRKFQPDVFYLEYVFEFFGDFLTEVKPYCRFIASWISSPLNENISYNGLDLIFSSTPDFVESFKRKGFQTEYMHPAFDVRILDKIGKHEKDIPLSFVGGWSEVHVKRKIALKELVQKTPIQLWGYNYRKSYSKRSFDFYRNIVSPINKEILNVYNGEAWGLKMYDIIQRSLITYNIHESLLKGYVGNMRMFEASGVGTMILNDEGKNLEELFVPGKEIETYASVPEAIEKINYYLANPQKAVEIGKNAQVRTVKDYNYDKYIEKLMGELKKYSGISD